MEDKQINWVEYPAEKPTQNGYYLTHYYNPMSDQVLYKALWYSAEQEMFQAHWPWAFEWQEVTTVDGKPAKIAKFNPVDVRKFVPESRADYYTMCGV